MSRTFRILVTLALLLAIPLQGLSAVLMPFHCLTDEHHGEAAIGAAQTPPQIAAHEHNSTVAHDPSDSTSDVVGHSCCNHVYTGAPSVPALIAPHAQFLSVDQISTALRPFFPERLLRPPRT